VSLLDRVTGTVIALLCMILATLLIAIASGWEASGAVSVLVNRLRVAPWQTAVVAVVILGAGLRLLGRIFPERAERVLVNETEFGEVRVAVQAVEQGVLRVLQQMLGVRSADVRVVLTAQGADVRLKLAVTGDLTVPDLSTRVQQSVEKYVRETIGVKVNSVSVEIAAVSADVRRVE
jgi:uncharacterized alkaline shock family protein YloU